MYLDHRLISSEMAKEGKAGVIFVQKTMLTEFKNKIREGRITVDDSFQYGQKDKTGEGRWLVFHDKKNKIFQVCLYLRNSTQCRDS